VLPLVVETTRSRRLTMADWLVCVLTASKATSYLIQAGSLLLLSSSSPGACVSLAGMAELIEAKQGTRCAFLLCE
jgi:hypothetical protein